MSIDAPSVAESRVLILSPTKRDGEVTAALLTGAGLACVDCGNFQQLLAELSRGAGAILLTEDAIKRPGFEDLLSCLGQQPSWSDLPVVMLVRGGIDSSAFARVLRPLRNVTLLERPAPTRSVSSAVQAAVRGRQRQYQIREHIESARRAEEQARDLQEQLEVAVNASELGTFHCDFPLDKITWNDTCKAHFWLAPDAVVDFELFYRILHPDDRERTRKAVEACVESRQNYDIEYRTVSPQGAIRWVRATGRTSYDDDGRPVQFDGTTQDITERKQAEEELRTSQERFQAMANSIPQLAWMARPDGWIFWYNQRWHDYCGTTLEQMQGWAWQSVHDPQDLPRIVEKWQTALTQGEAWEDVFALRRADGQFRLHLSRARPFRDAENKIILWFGTNTDITEERQRAEERQQLLESERAARQEAERVSRMKDEFLATLSHELRTPLNAIFGWTQLMKMSGDDAAMIDQGIEVIDRNVRLQTQLIEDLLDMSRVISGKIRLDVQRVDLSDVISAATEGVQPALAAKGIRLERVIDPLVGAVSGDPGRLQQIFWNLLTNAIKFTPKGGKIHILAERLDSHVEISVTDTGEGISSEFLPHLFERFSQADGSTKRKHGGLGLGLSIVKSLVELHGGAVRAESAGDGQGSTFVVQLPVRVVKSNEPDPIRKPTLASSPRLPHDSTRLRGVKILVVDDEADAREFVKRFLLECEAIPVLAASASEALDLVATFQPDLIVSDIGMPEQDGYEFMRDLRRHGLNTPAVALTAFARAEDRIRSIQAGYQTHLPKPVEPAELVAVLASLAGRFEEAS